MPKFKHPDLTETEKDILIQLDIAMSIIKKVQVDGHNFAQYPTQLERIEETLNKYQYGN